MIKRLILILVVSFFWIACNKKTAENNSEACEKPVMYKSSELALLMRKMYEDNDTIRNMILRGEWPDEFPSYFAELHTANATTPSDINDTYHGLAEEYLQRYDSLKKAPPALRREAYNYFISGCISCHQVYCNGPIPKIKKLLLPGN